MLIRKDKDAISEIRLTYFFITPTINGMNVDDLKHVDVDIPADIGVEGDSPEFWKKAPTLLIENAPSISDVYGDEVGEFVRVGHTNISSNSSSNCEIRYNILWRTSDYGIKSKTVVLGFVNVERVKRRFAGREILE